MNVAVAVVVGAYGGALGGPRQETAKATSWLGELELQRQWLAAAATVTTCGYCSMDENNGFWDCNDVCDDVIHGLVQGAARRRTRQRGNVG